VLDLSAQVGRIGQAPLQELVAEAAKLVEKHFIEAALRAADGRIDVAAQALRLGNAALVQRMQDLGVPLPGPTGHEGLPPLVN